MATRNERTMARRRRLLASLFASVFVVGIGCGSDSNKGSGTGSSDTDTDTDGGTATAGSTATTATDTATAGSTTSVTDGSTGGALPDPEDLFANVTFEEHPDVHTVLVVHWTQNALSDSTRLEFTFENDEWLPSPDKPGDLGDHQEVALGIPEGASLSFRLVADVGGSEVTSLVYDTINGDAPMDMPRADMEIYEPSLASDNRWLLGAVSEDLFAGPHWVYIIDRSSRVVWYHRPAGGKNGDRNVVYFPRLSRDGTHITLDRQLPEDSASLLFATLDFEYTKEIVLPLQSDCYDVTTDGYVLYNDHGRDLWEVDPSNGERRLIWTCPYRSCFSNTVNWDPVSDSVMLSFPYENTVVQIDRSTGNLLRTFGDNGDFAFDPPNLGLEFNHWAHINADGMFMVSSHLPNTNTHMFMEYQIDDSTQTLRSVWNYGVDDQWPEFRGMAIRLPGGNTLGNYGTTGVIVEITPDDAVAWKVDYHGQLLGNNILIDDLYALNRGP